MPITSAKRAYFKSAKLRRARALKKKRMVYKRPRIGQYGFHVHMYKRWADPLTWSFDGDGSTTYTAENWTFALNQVKQYDELTNLYDQFKIAAVVLKFSLVPNPDAFYESAATSGTAVSGENYYPKLWYYRDYDDSVAPTPDSIRQVGKAKCFTMRANKTYSIKLKPAVLNLLSGTTTQPIWPKRLDCTNNAQTHYGLKTMLDFNGVAPPSTSTWRIRVEKLFYVKMFNSR